MTRSFVRRGARLLELARAPRWTAAAIIALGLASALLEGAGLYLFIPLLGQLAAPVGAPASLVGFFERALAPVPADWRIPLLVAAIFILIVMKNGVAQLNHFVTQYTSGLVAHGLRMRLLRQTLDSCVDYRLEHRRTDLATSVSTHTWTVGTTLVQLHRTAIAACAIAVFVVLLIVISPLLTAFAIGFYALSSLLVQLVIRRAETTGRDVVEQNKTFGLRLWEAILSLRLIRACTREAYELRRFAETSDALRRRMLRMNMFWSFPQPLSEIAASLLVVALIIAGARLGLGLPVLATFLALLYRMQRPVRELLSARVTFDGGWAAVAEVENWLERTDQPYLANGSTPFPGLQHAIEVRDVAFRYPGEAGDALHAVSFVIPRATTTAIVGRSGAGKSTLLDLLFRFRDPTRGEILVDGTPLRELDIQSWRSRLAVMSQDVHVFNDSVLENIAYGRAGATPEEVRRAAEIAGAAEFIAGLPNGYDTLLGDAGARLSGGQKQRIALARTILRDPDILLLDEPTNALDAEAEHAFREALHRYGHERTVIVIAHRLATVEQADQIVVLDGGRVVECGSPHQLRAANGLYARLHVLAEPLTHRSPA